MMKLILTVLLLIISVITLLALTIGFGGPKDIAPLASINSPFKGLSYTTLPASQRYNARDGAALAYRAYQAQGATALGNIVFVHGSSARSNSMHFIAEAFANAGYNAYALDMRGHGESGTRGQLAYVGQLEDDVEDFIKTIKPQGKTTLAGFSSGGGFVLRFASGARQALFANYLLLAPFIHHSAATNKPDNGGWGSIGIPRWLAIKALNGMGVRVFNHLPVIRFALNEDVKDFLTPAYSYALAESFRPHDDYRTDMRNARQPMGLVAGADDELFIATQYAAVFKEAQRDIPITIVPKTGHIGLTLEAAAHQAAIGMMQRLNTPH